MARYNPSKVRNAYALSTLSVTLVLFLIGCVAFLIINIVTATQTVLDDTSVSIMLKEEVNDESRSQLEAQLKANEYVTEVTYISKDMAKEEFKKFTGEDITQFLDSNPLPQSFNVKIKGTKDYMPVEAIDSVINNFTKMDGVSEVLYQKDLLSLIFKNIRIIYVILAVFFIVLLLISIILINNTIKMTVFSKRFLIKTMKLVGATDSFVRKPFIADAAKQAVVSALFAWFMLGGVVYGYFSFTSMVITRDDYIVIAWLFSGVLVLAFIFCMSVTYLAVNKYMNLNNTNLHTY